MYSAKGSIAITWNDRRWQSKRDRCAEAIVTLSDDEIAAIEKSDMEPGLDHFNVELLSPVSPD